MHKSLKKLLFEVGLLFLLVFIVSRIDGTYGTLLIIAYFAYKVFALRYSLFSLVGMRKFNAGDNEGALKWYGKAAKVKNCRPRTILSYSYLLLISGKVDKASEAIGTIKDDIFDAREKINYYTTKALIQWKKNDLFGAIATLEDANKDTKALMIYESLGYLLIMSKDYEKALSFNKEALEYDESDEIINDNLAESYYFLGQYDKAKEIYIKLAEKPLTFPEPYYYLARIYMSEKKYDKARDLLEKATKCPEGFLTALHKEDIESAISELNKKQK